MTGISNVLCFLCYSIDLISLWILYNKRRTYGWEASPVKHPTPTRNCQGSKGFTQSVSLFNMPSVGQLFQLT